MTLCPDFQVREALPSDLDQLVDLFSDYRQNFRNYGESGAVRAFLKERLQNRDSLILVAVSPEGRLAGFVQVFTIFSTWSLSRRLVINDLFVTEPCRRMGAARAMIGRIRETACRSNFSSIEVKVNRSNSGAINIYKKLGFEADQHFEHFHIYL